MSVLFFIIFFCLGCAIGTIQSRNKEKREWNNGICPMCGKPWIFFDIGLKNCRIYVCDNWHGCCISYNVDNEEGNNS